jgi:hypothetical protein
MGLGRTSGCTAASTAPGDPAQGDAPRARRGSFVARPHPGRRAPARARPPGPAAWGAPAAGGRAARWSAQGDQQLPGEGGHQVRRADQVDDAEEVGEPQDDPAAEPEAGQCPIDRSRRAPLGCNEQVGSRCELLQAERSGGEASPRAGEGCEGFFEQQAALEGVVVGQADVEGQIQAAVGKQGCGATCGRRDRHQVHTGGRRPEPGEPAAPDDELQVVAPAHPEGAARRGRVEGGAAGQGPELLEQGHQRGPKALGEGGGHHAPPHPDQQIVAEVLPELGQGVADGRLGSTQPPGGRGDASLLEQHGEHHEAVEVEPGHVLQPHGRLLSKSLISPMEHMHVHSAARRA